ncbi:hypothetical protein HDU98_011280 [Podochytrium sp. JEL0797]|nr:hypothetical protein HDU98_011280 [Podochytrium sp. JEL0797]
MAEKQKPTTWNEFLEASLDADVLQFDQSKHRVKGKANAPSAAIDWAKALAAIPPPRLIPVESKALLPEQWERALVDATKVDVLSSPVWTGMESLLKPM